MATKSLFSFSRLTKIRAFSSSQRNFNVDRVIYNKPSSAGTSSSSSNPNVTGLSSNCIAPSSGPVGPGASKDSPKYKNPEYFLYNTMSYHEAEIEMLKYRCPQPSNKKPFKQGQS
ncbi:uncharacterized protein NdufV3 [Atheta coriaria]|uniref:uncharacterized protein NdufV3 n=1 Tax=Dalotia coriaria TaxID=877792 RepID=UPI0031F33BBE